MSGWKRGGDQNLGTWRCAGVEGSGSGFLCFFVFVFLLVFFGFVEGVFFFGEGGGGEHLDGGVEDGFPFLFLVFVVYGLGKRFFLRGEILYHVRVRRFFRSRICGTMGEEELWKRYLFKRQLFHPFNLQQISLLSFQDGEQTRVGIGMQFLEGVECNEREPYQEEAEADQDFFIEIGRHFGFVFGMGVWILRCGPLP